MFRLDWLTDEIVYVDNIGQWFAHHFFQYFFQFQHEAFPPTSPYFANPPLSMWILSGGIALGNLFNLSTLMMARAVDVLFGLGTLALLFVFCRRYFSARITHITLAISAIFPAIVALNASAYIDTISAFFVMLSMLFLFHYLEKGSKKTLLLLAVAFALGMLAKLSFGVLVIASIGLIVYASKSSGRFKEYWQKQKKSLLAALIVFIILPIVLWAGLRDFGHIKGVFEYYTQKRGFGLLTFWGFWDTLVYYFRMSLGIFQPEMALLLLGFAGTALAAIFAKRLRSRFSLILGFLGAYVLAHLIFLTFFAKFSTSHQLLPILPFLILFAVVAFFWLWEYLRSRWMQVAIALVFAGGILWPNLTFLPEHYELYNNFLVGGVRSAKNYYTFSNGEEIDQAGQWLAKNTPNDTRISVLGYDWIAKKFVGERTVVPHFATESMDVAKARGAEYFVLHYHFMAGQKTVALADAEKLEPIHTIYVRGVPFIKIYKLDYDKNKIVKKVDSAEQRWVSFVKDEFSKLSLSSLDNELAFDYFFKENRLHIASIMQKNFFPLIAKGLSVEIKGDNNKELLYFDFLPEGKKNYYRYKFPTDWFGWKKFYFPWEVFSEAVVDKEESLPKALQGNFTLRISIDSHNDIDGSLGFRNMSLSNLSEDVSETLDKTRDFIGERTGPDDQIAAYDFRDYLSMQNRQLLVQVSEDTSEALPKVLASKYLVIPTYKKRILDLLLFDYKQLKLSEIASFGKEDSDFVVKVYEIKTPPNLVESGKVDFTKYKDNKSSEADKFLVEANPQAVRLVYSLDGPGEWVSVLFGNEIKVVENTWLALEIFDDGNFENIYIDLRDDKNKAYLRYSRSSITSGKKILWIPLKLMKEIKEKDSPLSLSNPLQLKVSLDSGSKVSGEIILLSAMILELE